MATKVIDVSNHNGNVDFKRVKAAGIDNVIIRCGYTGYGKSHTLNKDARFEENYYKAKEAGLNVGTYYFAVALNEEDAKREAAFVLELLKDKQFELPVYYDVEDEHNVNASGVLSQNMKGLSKSKLTSVTNCFCETVEKAGYFVGIYSGKSWLLSELDMSILNRYTIWLAHWVDETDYTGDYALWQYTSSGKVDGVSTNVDMSYLYQDFASVIKRLGLNGFSTQTKPTEPAIIYGDVDGDTKVTEDDAMLALRRVIGVEVFTSLQDKAADMDKDGQITAEDAVNILRKAENLD